MAATAQGDIDSALEHLAARKDGWAKLSIERRLEYLRSMRSQTGASARDWVHLSVDGKRLPAESPLAGEEWLSGPYALLIAINALESTLTALAAGSDVLDSQQVRIRSGGQVVVDVFPTDVFDRLLLSGYRAEVWMQEGVTPANLRANMAAFYREADPPGVLGLILGAGNISSIPLLDVLTKMFTEGQVAVVKMNPVNDYLGPVFERICGKLIEDGFLRFVYGDGGVGSYLTSHELVDALHITGSAETYNNIVFGNGDEGARRRRDNEPLLRKPFSSELGGVGPTIVVPGPWTDADFAYHAEHLATQKFHNSGFNCVASQVLVLPDEWEGSDTLVDELRAVIRAIPQREAYYPGALDRHDDAVANYPHAELLGTGPAPPTLITNVDPAESSSHAFSCEFFGPVYATTRLSAPSVEHYLRAAVEFSNDTLAGTLGAQLLIHPDTMRRIGTLLDEAIEDLRYGNVGVNSWTGAGYLLPTATWGAYPGHSPHDVGSGMGVVHNAFMFDRPEKTVVHAPFFPFPRAITKGEFHMSPKPPWFVTHRRGHTASEALTRFAADPGWRHLPAVFAAALRH